MVLIICRLAWNASVWKIKYYAVELQAIRINQNFYFASVKSCCINTEVCVNPLVF